jgi:phage I-like protein
MPTQIQPPLLAALSFALPASGGDGAMQIFPAGEFDAPNGALLGKGPWRIDAESASALMRRVAALKNDIPVDYGHQLLLAEENGKSAPAAGWLSRNAFAWREGSGFFHLSPSWTAAARAAIAADEYRYVSAVFSYDPATGHPLTIHSVALTNTPAIDGMSPLVAALTAGIKQQAARAALSSTQPPESRMDEELVEFLEELRWIVSIPAQSTVAALRAALQSALSQLPGGPTSADFAAAVSARRPLNLAQAVAALSVAKPDPARFVPVGVVESLKSELAALSVKIAGREVDEMIAPALADGRLLPAQEAWARDLGKSNVAALRSYIETAQPIAALRGTQTGGKTPAELAALKTGELTATQLAVCKAQGISPEDYKQQLQQQAEA